jgi:predicted MPP superfamily phosphohydrolase
MRDSRPMTKTLTRRQALKTLAAAGAGTLALGLYTWRVEPHWLEFTFPELPISRLQHELEGRTLAQVSDLHVGPKVDETYILKSFRRVQELAPDFVAFTGDWITYRSPLQFEQLRRVLEHMPHGRLGTVGIMGNHDYGFNWRMADVAEQVAEITRAAGVTVLRNQAVTVAGLQFIGLDDLWGPRFDPMEVLAQRGQDASTVVLCHNPDAADRSVWGRYQGWILAGHTHGGQCKPPFLPPPLLPVKNRRYTAGEIGLSGNRRLYISRGVGHLLQVRFNVRPEIPVFQLRRSD